MGREGGDNGEEIISRPYFRSLTYVALLQETLNEADLNEALQKILAKFFNMEKYTREGSGGI